jgi:hypothetical protein
MRSDDSFSSSFERETHLTDDRPGCGRDASVPADPGCNGSPAQPAFTLHHDAWGRLVLTDAEGRQHVGVEPVRAFPLSAPRCGISITDTTGRELVWIDDLEEVRPDQRRPLEEHLAAREFVPVIRRVLSVSAAVEPSEWHVETDRGRTRFLLNSEEDVQPLTEHTALVTDAHGIRYLIPDTRQLDAASCRLLERFL